MTDVFTALPRREPLLNDMAELHVDPPQMMEVLHFHVSWYAVLWRLIIWIAGLTHFAVGAIALWVVGHRNSTRQAQLLLHVIERMGGVMVKIGQQMSIRVDLLPYVYCQELTKLIDRSPPFSHEVAVAALEREAGRPIEELLESFDPKPIGSASIACVFQGKLHSGRRVVVKVRRPKVGSQFAADLRVLDWLCVISEFLSMFRPGFTQSFRQDLREVLMEELNFRHEARYQELFRQRAKKMGTKFITAPKIHFDMSGSDVLVMDHVDALSLGEVVAALEHKDPAALAKLEAQNIKPKKVARRLLWINHAAMIADLFFHADPSPGNVFVLPNSKLVLIDFGSCGSFTTSQRRALKEINFAQGNGDPEGMAHASVAMMEPLPPIDVDAFTKELEKFYRLSVYAMKSKHAEWWERTTASQWLTFLRVSMAFKVPLPRGLLSMVRATLLYDTMAARLYPDIVFYDEFRRYEKFLGAKARKHFKKDLKRTLVHGLDSRKYLQAQQLLQTSTRAFFRFQHFLDSPPMRFIDGVDKGVYTFLALLRLGVTVTLFGSVFVAVFAVREMIGGTDLDSIDFEQLIYSVGKHGWFWVGSGFLSLLTLRKVLVRLGDRDV